MKSSCKVILDEDRFAANFVYSGIRPDNPIWVTSARERGAAGDEMRQSDPVNWIRHQRLAGVSVGTGVSVSGIGVSMGGTGVSDGGTGVSVNGIGVSEGRPIFGVLVSVAVGVDK